MESEVKEVEETNETQLERNCLSIPGISGNIDLRELLRSSPYSKFEDFKFLGSFATEDGQNFFDAPELSNIPCVNVDTLNGLNEPLHIDLLENYSQDALISSYDKFRKEKYFYFIQWLLEKQLLGVCKPDIVTTNGALVDLLISAYSKRLNTIFAKKKDGVIYLSTVPNYCSSILEEIRDPKKWDVVDRGAFMHLKFVNFVCNTQEIEETRKFYSVNEVQFASRKIIVLNEARAIEGFDENGDPKFIEMRTIPKKENKTFRILKMWAKNRVANVQTFIAGKRSANILEEMQIVRDNDLLKSTYFKESVCFSYLENALKAIVDSVEEDGAHVYEVGKHRGNAVVRGMQTNSGTCFLSTCPTCSN